MNPDEIEAIAQGKLNEFLSQFDTQSSDEYMQFGGFDLKQMMKESKFKSEVVRAQPQVSAEMNNFVDINLNDQNF